MPMARQGGHDLGTVAGADLGGVFAVGEVADVVEGFDAPGISRLMAAPNDSAR
jgi:hypothetical protein